MPPAGYHRRLRDNGDAALIRRTMTGDPDFCRWFAGFFDGEGTLNLLPAAPIQKNFWWKFTAQLALRDDDSPVLEHIRSKLGGNLGFTATNRAAHWYLTSILACEALAELFGTFPLRSKKGREVPLWTEALSLVVNTRSSFERNDVRIMAIRRQLVALRVHTTRVS